MYPYELKNYYLAKGYSLNDRVGTSYLEYQYEDILNKVTDLYNEYGEVHRSICAMVIEMRKGGKIMFTRVLNDENRTRRHIF